MIPNVPETVTAIYELPVPIWVSCAALNTTHQSGYGKVRFNVVMPQELAPTGGPPIVDGVVVPRSLDGKLVEWTTRYAAWIPEEFQPATALRSMAITEVRCPTEGARSDREPVWQLGECIKFWFDQVRSWVEVLTGQDLEPGHRIYDAETVGAGLTFITPPHEGTVGLRLTTPHVTPVTAASWRSILAAVRDNQESPLTYLLIRDANAAFARGFYRRAVIDAAAAVEITLVRVLTEKLNELPNQQRKRLTTATLGSSIDIARASGLELGVSFEDLKRLSASRNDDVHRAQAPDYIGTHTLLHVAGEFLKSPVRYAGESASWN